MEGVIDIIRNGEADERPGLVELNEELNLIPAIEGVHEHASLQFMAPEAPEVMPERIPDGAPLLGDVREDEPPFLVP